MAVGSKTVFVFYLKGNNADGSIARIILEMSLNHIRFIAKWNLVCFCDSIIVTFNSMKVRLTSRLPLNGQKAEQIIKPIYSIVDFDTFCPAQSKESQGEVRDEYHHHEYIVSGL